MKIRILKSTPHRVSSGLSLHFTAGTEVNVPAAIGEALVTASAAEQIGKPKPAAKGV